MTDTAPQSALRDLRAHLAEPATLAALCAVTAILALIGPFGTDQSLRMAPRAGYWGVIVLGTYGAGAATDILLRSRLSALSRVIGIATLAAATGLAVTVVVSALNIALLGGMPAAGLVTVFAVAAIVSAGIQVVAARIIPVPDVADQAPPPLLDRLPPEKRGALVALSVEDHYVRIRTARSEELVLMRLSDAIREAGGVPGLQVHRSHWVAVGQVQRARRDGDRAILSMTYGDDIPVSRSHIRKIREAGLLPR